MLSPRSGQQILQRLLPGVQEGETKGIRAGGRSDYIKTVFKTQKGSWTQALTKIVTVHARDRVKAGKTPA